MNDEKRAEIIKSLAFGMAAEAIADCEDVTVAEIEQIIRDCDKEIADKKSLIAGRCE